MHLNETYSRVQVGKHLYHRFPVKHGFKQGNVLLQLPFKFVLEYVIRRFQANQEGFKLNGTHQLMLTMLYVVSKHAYYKQKYRSFSNH
jgi:hypothetical protein